MSHPFDDVLAHSRAKQVLLRALGSGRLAHAWLLTGRDGIGKRLLAKRFAQALLCKSTVLGQGVEAVARCGTCVHCHRVEQELHPDVLFLRPEGASLLIKQIRDMQAGIAFNPFEARMRVVFIEEAHTLMEAAANALLKTLEEPTGKTIIILITDRPQQLLPTIISRCQVLRFAPFDVPALISFLSAREIPHERAERIAVLAEGSIGEALELCQLEDLEGVFDGLEVIEQLAEKNAGAVLELAAKLATDREQVQLMVTLLRAYLRDLMCLAAGLDEDRLMLRWRRARTRETVKGLDVTRIDRALASLDRFLLALRGNVNLLLAVEHLFFELKQHLHNPREPLALSS
ncbi:MAG: DNA polymerase III subunit delta' [Myxococcota bacterium]|jgi:DNA polymerase-3 subunit delta'|nr:DNA polymerase III subunit delta' [Myxococcota bacterium]